MSLFAPAPVVSAGLNKLALLGQVIHDLPHEGRSELAEEAEAGLDLAGPVEHSARRLPRDQCWIGYSWLYLNRHVTHW